ncbi:GIY-YIG nuclease family protein [Flagellimonas onchidii]|uniref:GIY-YIG nuclease family protein n=1 Tax=Flagellimonas onchidii TaxID=2562684 RepID=UPI0010A5BC7A|nr:GIY-YIG nuclease family protein [Allomuricauda onchidii]
MEEAKIYLLWNTEKEKGYIGCTTDFEERKKHHLTSIANGNHRNKQILEDTKTTPIECWEFRILETVRENEMYAREIHWIAELDTFHNGYNLRLGGLEFVEGNDHPAADKTIYTFYNIDGSTFTGTQCDFRKAHNLDVKKVNKLVNDKYSRKTIGKKWAMSMEDFPKTYTFYHIDGRIEENKSCAEMRKRYGKEINFNVLVNETSRSMFGWYIDKSAMPIKRTWYHWNGKVVQNVTDGEFSLLTGIKRANICEYHKQNLKTTGGWTTDPDNLPKTYTFRHTDGTVEYDKSTKYMRKKYGLSYSIMCYMTKHGKMCKGWTATETKKVLA